MLDWNAAMVSREQTQDLLHEAKQERLLRQGRVAQPGLVRWAFAWAGDRLMAWGSELSRRAGTAGYRTVAPRLQGGR
jgi:hypothetical protein